MAMFTSRTALIVLACAACLGLTVARSVVAQPATPGSAADQADAPTTPPPPPSDPGAGELIAPETLDSAEAEPLPEGPLHEAFAEAFAPDIQQGLVVPRQPPEPLEELPPEYRPEGEDVQWIPGYWMWLESRNDFVWVSGVWRAVPPGRFWTPGHWLKVTDGYRWISGYWSDVESDEVPYLPYPPESLDLGPTSPAPSDSHFWIPGCWQWQNNRYAWRAGYWYPGQANWLWVPNHYVYTPRGAVWVRGYWDYPLLRRGLLYAPVYWRNGFFPRSGYSYTPRRVINTALLLGSLFIDGNRGSYYYGRGFGGRQGFYPWYTGYRSGFYSPLYSYYAWQYGRDANTWRNRFDFDDRREGPRAGGRLGDNRGRGQNSLVSTVEEFQRSVVGAPGGRGGERAAAVRQLTDQDRAMARERAKQMHKYRAARADFETRPDSSMKARVEKDGSLSGKGRGPAGTASPDGFEPAKFKFDKAAGAQEVRQEARERYEKSQRVRLSSRSDQAANRSADQRGAKQRATVQPPPPGAAGKSPPGKSSDARVKPQNNQGNRVPAARNPQASPQPPRSSRAEPPQQRVKSPSNQKSAARGNSPKAGGSSREPRGNPGGGNHRGGGGRGGSGGGGGKSSGGKKGK